MSEGILYIVWDNGANYTGWNYTDLLERSIESAKSFGLKYHVHRVPGGNLLSKTQMYDISPFDNTLFLDADTVLCNDPSFGFKMSGKHGLAICLERASVLKRWEPEIRLNLPDYPEYNTGVIFFNKHPSTKYLFEQWNLDARRLAFWNDQPSFALSCMQIGACPFVLPENWNYRRYCETDFSLTPIQIWHSAKPINAELMKEIKSKGPGFSRIGQEKPEPSNKPESGSMSKGG